MQKKDKKKCFEAFLINIKALVYKNIYLLFYLLRKRKNWTNFGLYLRIKNDLHNKDSTIIIQNLLKYNVIVSSNLKINFIFLKSFIVKKYFKLFFGFFYGVCFFSNMYIYIYEILDKLLNLHLRSKLKKKSNFTKFINYSLHFHEINILQKTFNFLTCVRLVNNWTLKKKDFKNM